MTALVAAGTRVEAAEGPHHCADYPKPNAHQPRLLGSKRNGCAAKAAHHDPGSKWKGRSAVRRSRQLISHKLA